MEPQLKPVPIDSSQPAWRQPAPPAQSGATIVTTDQQKNVLRNTYWLLALSMVPTVLGARLGVATGLASAM
jgi:modulator of FtsH protease